MMTILQESDQLKEALLAVDRDGTAFPDRLMDKYLKFFTTIQQHITLATEERQAICEVNVEFVDTQIQLAENLRNDPCLLNVARTALNWNLNMSAEVEVSAEVLVKTYILLGYVDFTCAEDPVKILNDLETAESIAYCDQTLSFATVADVYDLRAIVLATIGKHAEAKSAAQEAARLVNWELDYQRYLHKVL